MKPFRFTLEALGTVRKRAEQKAMELYAQSLLSRRQALEALDKAEHDLNVLWQELRETLARGCTAEEAAQGHLYQKALVQRRNECAAVVEVAERRANAARQAMLQARQQREIVDKYFDKQQARHQRDQARGEQKFLDDLAGRRGASILTWKPESST
jgi:flagellar export protein FliJ